MAKRVTTLQCNTLTVIVLCAAAILSTLSWLSIHIKYDDGVQFQSKVKALSHGTPHLQRLRPELANVKPEPQSPEDKDNASSSEEFNTPLPTPPTSPPPPGLDSAMNAKEDIGSHRMRGGVVQYLGISDEMHDNLVEYGKWHTTVMRKWQQDRQEMPIFVGQWVSMDKSGGFADRVKFVLNLLTLGLITRRPFLVDWPDITEDFYCPYLEYRLSAWNYTIPENPNVRNFQDYFSGKHFKSKNLTSFFSSNTTVFVALNVPFQQFLLYNKYHKHFFGHFIGANHPPHRILGFLQRAVFQPTKGMAQFVKKYFEDLLPRPRPIILGLQIRTSGDKGSKGAWKDPIRLNNESYWCMMQCAKRHGNFFTAEDGSPGAASDFPPERRGLGWRLFLATDNSGIKSKSRDEFGEKLFTHNGTLVHLVLSDEKEVKASKRFVYLDYLVMSEHVDRLVLMNSGFGFLMGWRSLRPYLLHPYDDIKCRERTGAGENDWEWENPEWCPDVYPTQYQPKWPPRFPYGWVPLRY